MDYTSGDLVYTLQEGDGAVVGEVAGGAFSVEVNYPGLESLGGDGLFGPPVVIGGYQCG